MNPAMAENRDAVIINPWILALVDLCHDAIKELLGEKTVIASNIRTPIAIAINVGCHEKRLLPGHAI